MNADDFVDEGSGSLSCVEVCGNGGGLKIKLDDNSGGEETGSDALGKIGVIGGIVGVLGGL